MSRDDIALHGFAKRFKEAAHEEHEHAEKLIDYQNRRGGRVVFKEIAKPSVDEWGTAIEVSESIREKEREREEANVSESDRERE